VACRVWRVALACTPRARNLQPHLDPESGFRFPLVFEDHFGGGDRCQAMQVLELFLHLSVPGGLAWRAR